MIMEINNILPISVNAAYRTWKGRILISVKDIFILILLI